MDLTQELLNELAFARDARDACLEPYQKELKRVQANMTEATTGINDRITKLEDELRRRVLLHGETVKGSSLWAVYSKGRTSWDTKALTGYGAAHPEIMVFKTQGDPYVSITKARGGK